MKVVDANVLLYAVDERSPDHATAHGWLVRALGGQEPIGFSWVVLLAFLRVSTYHGFPGALTVSHAMEIVESWLTAETGVVIHPTQRHLAVLRGLLEAIGTAGNLTTDAHVAALAIEHGAEVVSFDRDFGRFPGLRWSMPADR